MLHLAGNAAEDVQAALNAAESGEALSWIVPKKAHSSDRALFHLPNLGLASAGHTLARRVILFLLCHNTLDKLAQCFAVFIRHARKFDAISNIGIAGHNFSSRKNG